MLIFEDNAARLSLSGAYGAGCDIKTTKYEKSESPLRPSCFPGRPNA